MDERLERHLCNLHNEVFEAAESRINTECSLTIREGISDAVINAFNQGEFPHYTWGYIVPFALAVLAVLVPSLYVRVYRPVRSPQKFARGFLTVCEGISYITEKIPMPDMFHHYMWRYIDEVLELHGCHLVLSLHVRVYRYNRRYRILNICNIYSPAITLPGLFFLSYFWPFTCLFLLYDLYFFLFVILNLKKIRKKK